MLGRALEHAQYEIVTSGTRSRSFLSETKRNAGRKNIVQRCTFDIITLVYKLFDLIHSRAQISSVSLPIGPVSSRKTNAEEIMVRGWLAISY